MSDEIKGERKEKALAALEWLAKTFPKCFAPGEPRPLKVGIHKDVLRVRSQTEGAPSYHAVRFAIALYVREHRYQKALTVGATRIGLEGEPAGVVLEREVRKPAGKRKPASKNKAPKPVVREVPREAARQVNAAVAGKPVLRLNRNTAN